MMENWKHIWKENNLGKYFNTKLDPIFRRFEDDNSLVLSPQTQQRKKKKKKKKIKAFTIYENIKKIKNKSKNKQTNKHTKNVCRLPRQSCKKN